MAFKENVKKFIGVDECLSILFLRQLVAELVATMLVVFIGISATVDWPEEKSDYMKRSLGVGIATAGVLTSIDHVSGGHVNPAISLSFLIIGKIGLLRCISYIIAQCTGGVAGSFIVSMCIPRNVKSLGLNKCIHTSCDHSLLVEFVGTFILGMMYQVYVDVNRADEKPAGPSLTGFTLISCTVGTLGMSSGGLNPARSFGPALVKMDFQDHWVFWAGPILGAMLASIVYNGCFRQKDKSVKLD